MKLQRSTLILMLSAVLLGGVVYVYEVQEAPKREAAKTKQQQIFSFREDDVQSLRVNTPKQTLAFERVSQKEPVKPGEPIWMMTVVDLADQPQPAPAACLPPALTPAAKPGQTPAATQTPGTSQNPATCEPSAGGGVFAASPTPAATTSPTPAATTEPTPTTSPTPAATTSPTASPKPTASPTPAVLPKPGAKLPASDASVAYLLSLLSSSKSARTIVMTNPAKQRQEFGLDEPVGTVEVKLKNQQTHRLILGKPDFNQSFLYAQANPSENRLEAIEVLLVPTHLETAIDRPLLEWKKEDKDSKPPETTPKDKKPQNPAQDKQPQGTSEDKAPAGASSTPKNAEGAVKNPDGNAEKSPPVESPQPDLPQPNE